jgi:hypothetical protein
VNPTSPGARPSGLVKTPEAKRPEPSPELRAVLDDMRRRYQMRLERDWYDPGGKDAA